MTVISCAYDQTPAKYLESLHFLMAEAYGSDTDGDEEPSQDHPCEAFQRLMRLDEEGRVIGHLAAYIREVKINDAPLMLGMIGDVATRKTHRHQGIARQLVTQAHSFFRGTSIDYAVLFAYIPRVYKSMGYHLIKNEVHVLHNHKWTLLPPEAGAMSCALGKTEWPTGSINLCGPTV